MVRQQPHVRFPLESIFSRFVCRQPVSPPLSYKLSFALTTGADAVDYEALAKAEHLSELEMFVREVHDRVLDIRHEQSYQKQREARRPSPPHPPLSFSISRFSPASLSLGVCVFLVR